MVANLKLVLNRADDRTRPFRNIYYSVPNPNRVTLFARIGHARTQLGALRAAVSRLAQDDFAAVDIYNEAGIRLYRIRRSKGQITINGAFYDVRAV